VPVETPKSAAARAYFAQVQRRCCQRGLLRTDGGGADTPFLGRMLADNFLRIALYDEYSRRRRLCPRPKPLDPARSGPVRVELRFRRLGPRPIGRPPTGRASPPTWRGWPGSPAMPIALVGPGGQLHGPCGVRG
jgi:hypothetical protein